MHRRAIRRFPATPRRSWIRCGRTRSPAQIRRAFPSSPRPESARAVLESAGKPQAVRQAPPRCPRRSSSGSAICQRKSSLMSATSGPARSSIIASISDLAVLAQRRRHQAGENGFNGIRRLHGGPPSRGAVRAPVVRVRSGIAKPPCWAKSRGFRKFAKTSARPRISSPRLREAFG